MFEAIAKPLASLLAFFYGLVPNYGLAIVLLTIVVMIVLTPFTVKSTRSMLAMQRLQPEIKRLQQQHKNDRQALNEAMMAFYKEHNVNPLGGCLPMLLQMPVFFGLYEAIRGLTHNPPKGLNHSSTLFKALCHLDDAGKTCTNAVGGHISMKSFGMDLANAATSHHTSAAAAIPFWLLIALTTATQYYQQRQLNNRNPQAAAANPQLQMTQKLFPIIFLVIYINIPAAVVLYFLVSNLLRIAQQGAMWKWDPKLVAEVATDKREIESKTIDAKAKPVTKGKPDRQPGKNTPTKSQSGKSSDAGNGAKAPPKPGPNKSGGSTGARSAPRQRGRARRGR
jgi:YidC/Oxa1 family membrane protein insertase